MKQSKPISRRRSALSAFLSAALCLTAVFASGSVAALAGPAPAQTSTPKAESQRVSAGSAEGKAESRQEAQPAPAETQELPALSAPAPAPVPTHSQEVGQETEGEPQSAGSSGGSGTAPVPTEEPEPVPSTGGAGSGGSVSQSAGSQPSGGGSGGAISQLPVNRPGGAGGSGGAISQTPANRPGSVGGGGSAVSRREPAGGTGSGASHLVGQADAGDGTPGILYRAYDRDLTLEEVLAEAGSLSQSGNGEIEAGYFYDSIPVDLARQCRAVAYDFDRRNTRAVTVYADEQGEISLFFESRFPTATAGLRILRESTGAEVCSWRLPTRSDQVYLAQNLEPGAAYRVELCSYYPGHYGITGTMLLY